MTAPATPPKVFISYCWSSEEHRQWVLDLATRLKTDGVDVILDRWHLKPGQDMYAFMEKMVTDPTVQKVLVVCDKKYAEKADARSGGVGTESQIISAEVYGKVSQEKFLPLIRERRDNHEPYLPTFLKSRIYFDFADADGYEAAFDALIRNLHNAPELREPAVGKPPAHIFATDTPATSTAGKFRRLADAVDKGRPNADVFLRDYLEALTDALEGQMLRASDVSAGEPDEIILSRINRLRPYRDEFVGLCNLYATYLDTEAGYLAVHDFLERLLLLHVPAEGMQSYSEWWFEPHQFLTYEWVLYLVAALINHRKYRTAARFADDTYQYRRPHAPALRSVSIGEFNHYTRVLEEHRSQRLGLRSDSRNTADIIKGAAVHPRYPFRHLVQADVVLMIRPLLANADRGWGAWYPRLSVYAESTGPLDLFARASTPKGLDAVRELLGARDVNDLARRIAAAFRNESFVRFMHSERFMFGGGVPHLLNWDELKQLVAPAG